MADKTITELMEAASVEPQDLFVLEQNSIAKKLSGQTLITYLLQEIDGHGGITSIAWTTRGTPGNGAYYDCVITLADGTTSEVSIKGGDKGAKGDAWYMHIRYADRQPISNADMTTTPSAWMGVYSGTLASAPTSYTSYTWNRVRGDIGPGAQLIGAEVLYQASSDGTTPTGTWQSTIPSINPGQYLWTRTTLTFDTGNPVSFDAVSYQGLNGEGAVDSVNGQYPDSSGNVAVDAADIPYNSTDVASELARLSSAAGAAQTQINVYGILKGSGNGVVSAATLGNDYGGKSFTVTLTADGWSNDAQTVSDSNFVASGYAYMVSPASASREEYNDCGIYADDVTTTGSMTFHCSSVPLGGLTVNVIRMVSA